MKTLFTVASLVALMAVPAIAQDATAPSQRTAPAIESPSGVAPSDRSPAPGYSGEVSVRELLNKSITNAANDTIGDINDVLIGADGKIAAVIVGVGGFLGMGEKSVAVRSADVLQGRGQPVVGAHHHEQRKPANGPRISEATGPLVTRLSRLRSLACCLDPEPLHGCVHFSALEDQMREQQEVLTTTEARQASPRRLNLRVLTGSLVLAIIAAAVLYTVFYAGNTQVSTPDPAPAQTTAPGP
jgi:hypothetical protein